MKIKVTMTEKVTYDKTYTLEEFADMIGEKPSEVRAVVENHDNRSGDYGIEGATDLLDDIIEKPTYLACEDRDWTFEFEEEK